MNTGFDDLMFHVQIMLQLFPVLIMPFYASLVKDSRAAKNYLQAPSSSSAADGGAAMELSVMAGGKI